MKAHFTSGNTEAGDGKEGVDGTDPVPSSVSSQAEISGGPDSALLGRRWTLERGSVLWDLGGR